MDLKLKLFEYGFALVAAPLAAVAVQLFKRYSAWLDSQSASVKRVAVVATVYVFLAIGKATGVDFGIEPGQTDTSFLTDLPVDAIKTALGAGVAFLLHSLKGVLKGSKKK